MKRKKVIIIVLSIILSVCIGIISFISIREKDVQELIISDNRYLGKIKIKELPPYIKDKTISGSTNLNISTEYIGDGYEVPANADDNGIIIYCADKGKAPNIDGMTREDLESEVNKWLAKECIECGGVDSPKIVEKSQVDAYKKDLASLLKKYGGEPVGNLNLKGVLSTKVYYELVDQYVVDGATAYFFNQEGDEFSGYAQEALWNNSFEEIENEGE